MVRGKSLSKPRSFLDKFIPYLLISPALVYLVFFIGYPLIQAILLAFFDDMGRPTLEYIQILLNDIYFSDAVKYTLLLASVAIPIQLAIAVALALLINTKIRGYNAFLYIYTIPLVLSDIAAATIWYTLLASYGLINRVIISLGGEKIYFLSSRHPELQFFSIVVAEVWRATAIVFVIVLAGLQTIPRDLIEAAEVFGATALQRLRHIVLPLLKPSIQAALLIRTLFAMQVFATAWVLTGRSIPVLAGEAYYWYTELLNPHVAAIYGLIIAGITIVIGILYIKFLRLKHLEGV